MLDVIFKIISILFFSYILIGIFFTLFSKIFFGKGLELNIVNLFHMILLYPIIEFEEEE